MAGQITYELSLLKQTAENVIRSLVEDNVLKDASLKKFLNDRRHYLYHQCYTEGPCCQCSTDGDIITIRDTIKKETFQKFYSTGRPNKTHIETNEGKIVKTCIHQYIAKDVSLDDFDLDTLIIILLNNGSNCTTKPQKKLLKALQESTDQLDRSIKENELQPSLNIGEFFKAVLDLIESRYYRNVVELLLKDKLLFIDISMTDTKALTTNKDMPLLSRNSDWRDRIVLHEKQKNIDKISLHYQYGVLQKRESDDKSKSYCKSAEDRYRRYVIEVKLETKEKWETDKIISRLNKCLEQLMEDSKFEIRKISKGSIAIIVTTDEATLSDEPTCSAEMEKLLSRTVKFGNISSSSKLEIKVNAEIKGQVDDFAREMYFFAHETHVTSTMYTPAEHLFKMLGIGYIGLALNKHFKPDIFVDPVQDGRIEGLADLTSDVDALLPYKEPVSTKARFLIMLTTLFVTETEFAIDILKRFMELEDMDLVYRTVLGKIKSCDRVIIDNLQWCLKQAVSSGKIQIAKAIAWKLVRIFLKSNPRLEFRDIWPGIECHCRGKKHLEDLNTIFCSNKFVIVVEVSDDRQIKQESNFFGISVKYLTICKFSTEARNVVQHASKKDTSTAQIDISEIKGVSENDAKHLFSCHRNLTLISKSAAKSIKFWTKRQKFVDKPCIQLYCRAKGIIPVGEPHFPTSINNVSTDIIEGYPEFRVQTVSIGDDVGFTNKSSGTLGGFLRYRGKDAFLTCAHVVFERKHLAPGADLSFIDDQKITIHCKNKTSGEIFPCGKYVDHRFPPDKSTDGVSIDAAIVKLQKDCIINKSDFPYLNDSVLDYREIGTNSDIETFSVGAVSSNQSKLDSVRLSDSPITTEFETLCTLVERTWQDTARPGMCDDVHLKITLQEAGETEKKVPRQVELYNQIAFNKVNFNAGDSGMCIYAKDRIGRKGCVGMAIASHPNGGCIVTPIKPILSSLKISCKRPDEPMEH